MPPQDTGEWNQVKRTRGRLRTIPTPTTTTTTTPPLPDLLRPNPHPELSADDLWRYHHSITTDWQTTEWWAAVRAVVESALMKGDGTGDGGGEGVVGTGTGTGTVVSKAVLLGPGPFEPANGSVVARRTAHLQTAAFLGVVEQLKAKMGREIKRVVQEPRFTETDKEFCGRLGLEAVDSPGGFEMVDGETLVFGIHMELEIYNLALRTLPAVFVGASLEEWERVVHGEGEGGEDPLVRFKEMEEGWERYAFPDLEYMFSSTVMYWRRGGS